MENKTIEKFWKYFESSVKFLPDMDSPAMENSGCTFLFLLCFWVRSALPPPHFPKTEGGARSQNKVQTKKVAPIFSKSLPDGGHPLQKAISYPVMLDCLGNRLPNPRWMRSVKIRNIRPRMALSCCRKNGDMPPPHFRNFPVLLEKAKIGRAHV